jgi:methylmalonyl-CoA mutase cobalamin-binding domain/chain
MDDEKHIAALKRAILSMDYDLMSRAAREAMEAGVNPQRAILEGMSPAMTEIGEKFQSGEYYLPELIVAGDVMKEGLKIVSPYLKGESEKGRKKLVIATVQGDNHDIGKNIAGTLLSVHGFEVVDLGIDVSPEKILDAVKEHKPAIVGLSALLTVTMPKMAEVLKALREAGLRDGVKVILGGTAVTPEFARRIGADYATNNAAEGVKKCLEWIKE